jgi:hypothetical protein
MNWSRHPQSTRPMKRGRPLTSGNCATRAELESEVAKRRALGWNVNRIAVRFELNWRTARDLIQKLEGNT